MVNEYIHSERIYKSRFQNSFPRFATQVKNTAGFLNVPQFQKMKVDWSQGICMCKANKMCCEKKMFQNTNIDKIVNIKKIFSKS